MIVIEGKQGKSKKLEEILNGLETNESKYIYMFDAVGINLDIDGLITYSNLGTDCDGLLSWSKVCLGKYIDMGYIVFEYNIPVELKDQYIEMAKSWEKEFYIDNVIITIQNNDLDELKVYEL